MPKNLDLVCSISTDWERGDFSSGAWADPDIELIYADGPSPGTWTGLTGVVEGFRDFLSAWQDVRPEVEAYRELDQERVLALVHRTSRGKASGVELVKVPEAELFHIRALRVTKIVWYCDRALADLGPTAREAD